MSSAPRWRGRSWRGSATRPMTRRPISRWFWCRGRAAAVTGSPSPSSGSARVRRTGSRRPHKPRSMPRRISSATAPMSTGARTHEPGPGTLSDNRVEVERASHALQLAAEGRTAPGRLRRRSRRLRHGGYKSLEALEAGPAEWHAVPITVEPGITAMLAAAARAGALLGAGDFCAISLSDNLRPDVVTARFEAALIGIS